ncbi:hypothetical protein EON64_12880 [archaeon]|nr:MAG: hypothetical protein EON64_12880 [archaeon]
MSTTNVSASKSASVKNEQNLLFSRSLNDLDSTARSKALTIAPSQVQGLMNKAQQLYLTGAYTDCLSLCDKIYEFDAHKTDNLILMGAAHFQLRNYSESVFYNQQCIKVDPHCAEAFSNLGNALKELGDLKGATQFYLKVRRMQFVCLPIFCYLLVLFALFCNRRLN